MSTVEVLRSTSVAPAQLIDPDPWIEPVATFMILASRISKLAASIVSFTDVKINLGAARRPVE
jgi:hypothetical protein